MRPSHHAESPVSTPAHPIDVDLSSDTATKPTRAMLEAMICSPVGDEQRGEDPTVSLLEERAAVLLGQERALFLPTATMANQIAMALHCHVGDEILCHDWAHVYMYEAAGAAMTARAQICPIPAERGIFDIATLEKYYKPADFHLAQSKLLVVENTSNMGGGTVWPVDQYDSVVAWAHARDMRVHIDGARLVNASRAAGVPMRRWGARADTVQLCFSKALGCPCGAVLALPASLWPRARKLKQALGGAMRQAGILAGAMLYALDHHIERIDEDHRRAKTLAAGFAKYPDLFDVEKTETNLVFFSLKQPTDEKPTDEQPTEKQQPPTLWRTGADVCRSFLERGIRIETITPMRIRACTHLDIDDTKISKTLQVLDELVELHVSTKTTHQN